MPDRQLWFVRHGESQSNVGGISLPHDRVPLTARGHAQAANLPTLLPVPSRVLVSGLSRTHETAAPYLARHGVTATTDRLLDEFDMISFELIDGMDGAGRRVLSDGFWATPDPDRQMGVKAESFRRFAARVNGFMQTMHELPDATVVFGHGTWLGMLLWRLQGGGAETATDMAAFRSAQQRAPVQNAEVVRVRREGAGWRAFRRALAVACVLLVSACGHARTPDGYTAIDCSGWFEDWGDCVAAADEMCEKKGGYVARWYEGTDDRTLRVKCAGK